MRLRFTFFLFIFSALLAFKGSAQHQLINSAVNKAMQAASADEIKASIAYLADDKLAGRMPGKPGYQMAADYVISKLKSYGVKPAGENGTWLQKVRLRRAFANTFGKATLTINGKTDSLAYGKQIFIYPDPIRKEVSLSGELVFAGYGITNKQLGYNSYQNLNVKGKIVLVFRGAPKSFPSSDAAYSANLITIQQTAAANGAKGVILISADSSAKAILPYPGKKGLYSVIGNDGSVVVSRNYYKDITLAGAISYETFKSLIAHFGKNPSTIISLLKSGVQEAFAIPASLNISANFNTEDITSYNVVGVIHGSDGRLKDEYVVHSAHLDHLGIDKPVEGDSIYNGAHDNASGVASLLQIAKIYHNLNQKPKRSVIILMVTGEEMGDLGSGYFANHPTVPLKNIVADVNTDMPAIIAPLLSVAPLGAEHSSLINQVNQAAGALNITVEPDPEPKELRFVRSDQYSFVIQGIPALHIKYGNKTADGKNNLNEFVETWRKKYYHKPQDDINGIFDFNAGKKYAQLNFLIGYLIADSSQKPVWNKGDIFEKD